MTVKEWYELELPVTWSIYNEAAAPEVKYPQKLERGKSYLVSEMICEYCGTKGMDCDCDENLLLNLDAPVPDGVYSVKMRGEVRCETGITVKDGKFVPKPTAYAIYRLVVNHYYNTPTYTPTYTEPIDHNCVERIIWGGTCFEVFMGS